MQTCLNFSFGLARWSKKRVARSNILANLRVFYSEVFKLRIHSGSGQSHNIIIHDYCLEEMGNKMLNQALLDLREWRADEVTCITDVAM